MATRLKASLVDPAAGFGLHRARCTPPMVITRCHLDSVSKWLASGATYCSGVKVSAWPGAQKRCYLHSAELQRFFTNRTHKKFCPSCTKPSALPLDICSFCGQALGDGHIQPIGRDPLVEAVALGVGPSTEALAGRTAKPVSDFAVLHRSFEVMVLQHRFPVGRLHLLALPKETCYDVRRLRRSHMPLLRKLRDKGMACLRQQLKLPEAARDPAVLCGFSYPADYNHLHLHLVLPPFLRTDLFTRYVFYTYEEVQDELENRGQVRPHQLLDLKGEELMEMHIATLQRRAIRATVTRNNA